MTLEKYDFGFMTSQPVSSELYFNLYHGLSFKYLFLGFVSTFTTRFHKNNRDFFIFVHFIGFLLSF